MCWVCCPSRSAARPAGGRSAVRQQSLARTAARSRARSSSSWRSGSTVPLLGTEVKRWMAAEKAPVDPAVFGAVQLIYLARPGFGHGLHDPVPRRSGIWQGEADTVAVPELLPEPEPHTLRERRRSLRAGRRAGRSLRRAARPPRRRAARPRAPDAGRPRLCAPAWPQRRSGGAGRGAGGRRLRVPQPGEVAGYGVDRLVDHVVRQERAATWMPFGRAAPKAILPPCFGEERRTCSRGEPPAAFPARLAAPQPPVRDRPP